MKSLKQTLKTLLPQSTINSLYHKPLAVSARLLAGSPGKRMTLIGVTGTDGKTTTVFGLYHLLTSIHAKAGYISTVNAVINGQTISTGLHTTTPSALTIQNLLKHAEQAKSTHLVLETTSHGLDQNRLWGVPFDVGIITNITHEHLDYHKTYERYVQAKAKIFTKVKTAIINKQDISYQSLTSWLAKHNPKARVITFALDDTTADVYAGPLTYKNGQTKFTCHISQQTFPGSQAAIRLTLPLLGPHNVANALAVISAGLALRIEPQQIRRAINTYPGVPGRMEYHQIQNRDIFIDFAHTPNGMQHVLRFLRQKYLKKGHRLIAVFGCTGERDKEKRPHMGQIAAENAHLSILTSDDTRSENINQILDQIEPGCLISNAKQIQPTDDLPTKQPAYIRIPDRQTAIDTAAALSRPGDVIALLGKGHETTILHGTTEYPWSELDAITTAFDRMK